MCPNNIWSEAAASDTVATIPALSYCIHYAFLNGNAGDQHYNRYLICWITEQSCGCSTSIMGWTQGSGREVSGKNYESLLYKLLPSLTLSVPWAFVVNYNVFLVNSSGMCFQSVCYISGSWESLRLKSHNHVPSQPTENHITETVCLFMMEGKGAFYLERISSSISVEICIYTRSSRDKYALVKHFIDQ